MTRSDRWRRALAYALWSICAGLALLLAGGVLLVALKADPSRAPWSWWLAAVDAVTPGWFQRPDAGALGASDLPATLLRWGTGAVVVLAAGLGMQRVVRPR